MEHVLGSQVTRACLNQVHQLVPTQHGVFFCFLMITMCFENLHQILYEGSANWSPPPPSLVPNLIGPLLIGPPAHWSPNTLLELIGPPSHWSPCKAG